MSISMDSFLVATNLSTRMWLVKRKARSSKRASSILAYVLLTSLAWAQEPDLSSWNDSVARRELVQLIAKVEDTSSSSYLPPEDRIAVFDIDGTLWPERPTSIAGAFYVDRIKNRFNRRGKRNFKRGDDWRQPTGSEVHVNSGFDVGSVESYKRDVRDWLSNAKHPSLKVQYSKLVYAPMQQLIGFLKLKRFKVYLVTAAEDAFMKAVSEELFGVPSERVIGTQMFSKLSYKRGGLIISRSHIPRFVNSRSNKVIAINDAIGKRPIIAFGNSEGDREMLRWVASGGKYNRSFLIKHDDRVREFAYQEEIFGERDRYERPRVEGEPVIVSMKQDWKQVFQWR